LLQAITRLVTRHWPVTGGSARVPPPTFGTSPAIVRPS